MSFFNREKPKSDPVDKTEEFADWNDAISRFRIAVDKPVLVVRDEVERDIKAVENGIKALENGVKTDLKPVETAVKRRVRGVGSAIKHEWVMLRIPKETRELLKSKQLEGETYAETIKRAMERL